MDKQVVSKQRVADHGEVLTGRREVNAMLDLVKSETERIDSRFLEPACGTGNFLAEILERKLRVLEARYGKSQLDYERYAILAASSVYGIDILEDNVRQCRQRLFGIFDLNYLRLFKNKSHDDCRESVRYILERKEANDEELSPKEKKALTEEEKEYKSLRKQIQEKLIKFATRVPIFMYLTDYRERTLKDVITQLEPGLFKKVTGLTVKDFELLVGVGVFNSALMNDAVYKFKRYEDASLSYTGINKHEGEDIGLYDTVLSRTDYQATFVNEPVEAYQGTRQTR